MTELLLTCGLGFGVTSLATIALTNVVAVRVHDLTTIHKSASTLSTHTCTYTRPNAEKLRKDFHNFWITLTIAAVLSVGATFLAAILYEELSSDLKKYMEQLSVVTLFFYILATISWAINLSVRFSDVLKDGFDRPTSSPFGPSNASINESRKD